MFGLCVAEREPVGTHPPESASDPAPFGLHALWRAYRACRKGKRHTRDAQQYQVRLLDGLVQARDALASASWRPSPHLCFVVDQPKRREIHAAPFADRVVHHLLTERLARLYEPVFIHDSYANRKGKGTLAAVDRLQQCMRSGAAGQGQPGQWYALQLDIANFFNRIHRPTLFGLLQHRLVRAVRRQGLAPDEARTLQTLCRALLQAAPTEGVRRKGPPARFAAVPPHKRLAAQEPGRGLPIGNLTSQFFANVYLNELDQFVKHQLKARHYLRYVDDFVLLHPDPAQLVAWRDAIEAFLAQRLGLALKERSTPRHVSAGATSCARTTAWCEGAPCGACTACWRTLRSAMCTRGAWCCPTPPASACMPRWPVTGRSCPMRPVRACGSARWRVFRGWPACLPMRPCHRAAVRCNRPGCLPV